MWQAQCAAEHCPVGMVQTDESDDVISDCGHDASTLLT